MPEAPVRSVVQRQPSPNEDTRVSPQLRNYQTVVDALKSQNNADARAILAMFGGDKELMNRFIAVAFSSLSRDSDLLINADPMTIVQSIKDAAALGLEPTGLGGEGVIIRYGREATFQPMWRGYVKRIRNSREVVDIDCQLVYEQDRFELVLGTNPGIIHIPALEPDKPKAGAPADEEFVDWRGSYRGCYAWALMPSGKYIIEWMTTEDINYVRDTFSKAKQADSPWATSWGEMARKTVIRRLSKRLPGAAVDKLLEVEGRADRALDEAKAMAEKALVEVRSVQQMALEAVGLAPKGAAQIEAGTGEAAETAETGETAQATTNEEQSPAATQAPAQPEEEPPPLGVAPAASGKPKAAQPADPGVDPNVQAAMALNEEEQLRRQRKRP